VFWNVKKNELTDCLIEMIMENDIDLLVLAEYTGNVKDLCESVNAVSQKQYNVLPNNNGCRRIYGLVSNEYIVELLFEHAHYQLISARSHKYDYDIVVAMIHARSQLEAGAGVQRMEISQFYSDIVEYEESLDCKHTLAIGDFNISPFEDWCFGASGMHAIPFRDAVAKDTRKVLFKSYRKFYNPTWRLFGNKSAPYTTYYCNRTGEAENLYWYAFDQVIVRPSLVDAFDDESLKIITSTANHILLKKDQTPDNINYSDHLPLFCCLKEDLI